MATPPDFTAGQVLTAAQMNAVGMWKITPTSVTGTGASIQSDGSVLVASGGTTFTILGAFPTDFQVFDVVINDYTLSGDAGCNFQLRTGVTTSNTGYYFGNVFGSGFYNGTGSSFSSLANQTSFDPRMISGTGGGGGGRITLYNVNLAKPTGVTVQATDPRVGGSAMFSSSGYHSVATAYDQIVFNVSGVNFTRARVSIYGYN
jgi:hypothetical protein